MDRYELRGEVVNAADGKRLRWHFGRPKALTTLCGQVIDPRSVMMSVSAVEGVPASGRCAACWRLAVSEVHLPP